MERRILMPGLLVVSIFAMAGVYDFMWIARPDYFRLQSGVNFLPLDLVHIAREYSAYSDNQPLPDMLPEHGEEVATKRIEDIYQNFRLASVSLANKKADLAKRLQQDAGEYKSFEQAQWAQYEEFVAQKSAPFAKQSNLISERMQSMLTAAGAISPDDLPPGPRNAYYDLNIERARVELQRVRAEAEARDYGLHHLTEFQQQTSQQAYLARSRELREPSEIDIRRTSLNEHVAWRALRRFRRLSNCSRGEAWLLGLPLFQCSRCYDRNIRRHLSELHSGTYAGLPAGSRQYHIHRTHD